MHGKCNCLERSLQFERLMMLVIVKPTKWNENESFHTALAGVRPPAWLLHVI